MVVYAEMTQNSSKERKVIGGGVAFLFCAWSFFVVSVDGAALNKFPRGKPGFGHVNDKKILVRWVLTFRWRLR